MIQRITSKQNSKIKHCQKLYQPNYRDEYHQFLIEGYHLLEMALHSNAVLEIYTTKEIKEVSKDIPQFIVDDEILRKIASSTNPQGVVAVCSYLKEEDVKGKKVLYLDQINDPGNLGTIFRSALAFDYEDVVLSKKCCSPYNEKAIQASQGAIFELRIHHQSIDELKEKGYQIIATEIKGSLELSSVKPAEKHVLILGNESHGVTLNNLKKADLRVRIDIKNIESLNVGVAAGIAMYALSQK